MRYITDIGDYSGPVENLSPYHYYQYLYWRLRTKWRKKLYDWTRRDACDASASVTPTTVVAGETATVTITVQIGETPLAQGGRIAVYFPLSFGGFSERRNLACFQGPDGETGYGARITAHTSRKNTELAVQIHSTGSVFLCTEIIVDQGRLEPGDDAVIVIGDPSCKPAVINERAKTFPLRVAIDFDGNDTFQPVRPDPTIHVVGGRARYLRCFAPGTPRTNEPFSVRVSAADLANHNPAHCHAGHLVLTALPADGKTEVAVEMLPEHHGTMPVPGVTVTRADTTLIQVHDRDNGLMGLTNPVCPEMAYRGQQVYYGEIHSHTEISDGLGIPEDNYRWARDVEGLDFAALADHFEDGQSYNYTLEDKWRITGNTTAQFNEPGRFVTLLGYEIGTLEQHRNVYFADDEGRMIVEGRDGEKVTMTNVFDKLDGTEYILIPHAPKFHGINWHCPHDPATQRLVEICSTWGISEEGGPLSVRHALDLGYKFGFTGGTDNHCAEPGNPDLGGITGVFAAELDRRHIFDALKARRSFATSGPRMILHFFLNDAFMGEETTATQDQPRCIRVRAVTCEAIDCIEIIRNGTPVHRCEGNNTADMSLEWEDTEPLVALALDRELTDERFVYYYARVKTVCGGLGWTSPVWVHA